VVQRALPDRGKTPLRTLFRQLSRAAIRSACMQRYALVTTDDFPLVRVTFTGQAPTETNFPLYLAEVKATYGPRQPLAILFDARRATLPGLSYQKMQARWIKENEDLLRTYCRGTAYVIPNAAVRAILRAILSLQPQPMPSHVCATVEEGVEWLNEKLNA